MNELETYDEYLTRLYKLGWPCSTHSEYLDWYVTIGRSRESKIIEESNFESLCKILDENPTDTDEPYVMERARHSMVGWVEELLVNPKDDAAIRIVLDVKKRLENYSILDEEDVSQREWDERENDWKFYGRRDFVTSLEYVHNIGYNVIDLLTDEDEIVDKLYEDFGEAMCESDGWNFDTLNTADAITRNDIARYIKQWRKQNDS